MQHYGQRYVEDNIKGLAGPEDQVVFARHGRQFACIDLFGKVLIKVLPEDPEERADRVEKGEVKVLDLVGRNPLLGAAHPDEGTFGDIIIHAVHIGIGMVNDVVLLLPHKAVAAQRIQGITQELIDPAVGGIAAVAGIVHDIEADKRQHKAEQTAQQYPCDARHRYEKQQGV